MPDNRSEREPVTRILSHDLIAMSSSEWLRRDVVNLALALDALKAQLPPSTFADLVDDADLACGALAEAAFAHADAKDEPEDGD